MISFKLTELQMNLQRKFRQLADEMLHSYSLKVDDQTPGPIDKTYLETFA